MNEIYTRNVQIINYIKEKKQVKTEEIAKEFYLSESSVRRIFDSLEKQGAIKRIHGGATISETNVESALNVRSLINYEAKRKLAKFALPYIPEFTSIFLDNSSTVLALAKAMDLTSKTVVTNGLSVALELTDVDTKELICLGGPIRKSSTGIYGSRACEALNGFAFDVMIFSCASIDSTSTYESTDDVASFKYVSKRYGRKKILIVDSSKFDKSNPCRSFFLNSFDLILTDASHEIVDPIKEQGANIITSSED